MLVLDRIAGFDEDADALGASAIGPDTPRPPCPAPAPSPDPDPDPEGSFSVEADDAKRAYSGVTVSRLFLGVAAGGGGGLVSTAGLLDRPRRRLFIAAYSNRDSSADGGGDDNVQRARRAHSVLETIQSASVCNGMNVYGSSAKNEMLNAEKCVDIARRPPIALNHGGRKILVTSDVENPFKSQSNR
jgi:hypothetical protein